MSSRLESADRSAWQQLLNLGRQLVAQPTVVAQRQLIIETALRMFGGQADLWLAELFHFLAGLETSLPLPTEAPSDLMRRALDARQSFPSEKAELSAAQAIAVPLIAQDTVLGVLEVRRPDGPPFSSAEIELLDGLATQSASALLAARQVATERWRVAQLSLVRKVSAQVADVLDLDELCRRVAELILSTFNYYYVALFTLEPGQPVLRRRANAGPPCPQPEPAAETSDLQIRLGDGIIGHAAQAGTEILANDVHAEPHFRSVNWLPETRSEVALPLTIEERVLGVIDVQSDQPDDFDETDMLVLRALADQIAIAVEDARLYDESRRRADQLAAVAEVSRAITSILDIDALLDQVVALIHKQFGYPFVYLFTTDPARGQIAYRAGSVPPSPDAQTQQLTCSLDDSAGIVSWVACHGEAVLVNDVSHDPRYRPLALPPAETRSELAVPLIFGGNVLGVLDVQSDRRDAFSDDDRFLFQALAGNVAIAMRNANLYRSEQWRRQVADSLREVAGLLSADLALDQVLDAILTELERTLPCDVAAIWLLDDGILCLSAIHGTGTDLTIGDISPDTAAWLTEALDANQPLIRTPASPAEPLGMALEFPADYSAIGVPLRVGDRRLGVLTLAHRTAGRYGVESRMITTAFASYAAVAIENTRLYQAAQEQAWISTVMLQVAEATQSLTTLDEVLKAVVRLAPMLAGVDRCALLLWDEPAGTFAPAAAYGLSPTEQAAFAQWHIAPGDAPAFDHLRIDKTPIGIQDAGPLLPGERRTVAVQRGTVAVDGEREIEFGPRTPVTVTLAADGPRVLDVRTVLAAAAERRLLVSESRQLTQEVR